MAQRYRQLAALFPAEVLVSSSASSAQRGALYVLDPASTTQTPLVHWKGVTHVAPHGLSCVPSATHAAGDGGMSGLAVAIETDKAVLSVYSWQKDQPVARMVLPQKMRGVALSPRGTYVAAGTDDGRLFVWEVCTGSLVCSFEAHYRALTLLAWSEDEAGLVTGSDDGRVCVWSVVGLALHTDLAGTAAAKVPAAYATFSDHTLPITAVHVSSGRFPESLAIWTASRDASVKVWDGASRRLVSTFALPGPVAHLAVDALERFFFASVEGTGEAYRVELYTQDPGAWHARGGRGAEGVVENVERGTSTLTLAEPITSLCLTRASSHLALGTNTGQVHLVDVATLQVVRVLHASASLSATPNTPVTNLVALPRAPDLLAAVPLRAGGKRSASRDTEAGSTYVVPLPMRPLPTQLARTLAPPRETPTVLLRIGDGAGQAAHAVQAYLGTGREPLRMDTPTTPQAVPAHTGDTRIHELESDLRRAKALNDAMWQHLVQTQVAAEST